MRYLALVLLAGVLPAQQAEIRLTRIATGLTNPLDIQDPGDGAGRLFFVQQNGIVRAFRNGQLLTAPFLDIRSKTAAGGERGLLGMAFPPGFAGKQHFYVNYTDRNGNTVVARYRVGVGTPDQADAGTEEVILRQTQPFANHNGGGLRFGPDGYLYIGLGDGGSGGDPMGNAQARRTWLGKMLRIDVEAGVSPYRVPPDNPFVNDASWLPEIWSYGLRNPFRYSFDRETGDLWIGDVGQDRAEEIDFQPASSRGGENYGWARTEGLRCYQQGCSMAGVTLPVFEYTRGQGDVCVIGGSVYRGAQMPSLRGTYVYADNASGRIWGLRREGSGYGNRLLLASGMNIAAIGEDAQGELYVAAHGSGAIYRIEAGSPAETQGPAIRAVVNAASNVDGIVAGSAATVYATGVTDGPGVTAASSVPLPRVLGGIRVKVNGVDAPLYAVANTNGTEQVNFQVPFETTGTRASIIVERDGQPGPSVEAALLAAQPGVFTADGTEAIVVHHADNTLATLGRPLRRGEFAYLYVSGLGSVSNAPLTGAAASRAVLAVAQRTPAVTMDGVECEVLFAGLAPDFVGVYQVNIRIAQGVGSGARNVIVSSGGVASQAARVWVE